MNSMQDWYDYRRTMEQPRLASNDPSISGGPTRGIPPGGTIDIGPLWLKVAEGPFDWALFTLAHSQLVVAAILTLFEAQYRAQRR